MISDAPDAPLPGPLDKNAASKPVALVTGGAVRVGRALCLGLAGVGYDLAVHYHSSEAEANSLQQEVERMGRRCGLFGADLADADAIAQFVGEVETHFGRLDLLINSASIFHEQPLFEAGAAEWDRVMAINVRAPFLVTRAAGPMLSRAKGNIVNIVDISAFQPWVRYPHHAVSKAALLHLTRITARELGPDVRANAVAPGTVLPPEGSSEAENEYERSKTLVGHLGTPQDVVEAVLFLARSEFVTGEVIVVDGGMRWGSTYAG